MKAVGSYLLFQHVAASSRHWRTASPEDPVERQLARTFQSHGRMREDGARRVSYGIPWRMIEAHAAGSIQADITSVVRTKSVRRRTDGLSASD
jgi:hypothetical protein